MKKLISITLVLTMLFSLCTLNVSAKETDYAVQFLKSLGIVKGDENGNMNLNDNVTLFEKMSQFGSPLWYNIPKHKEKKNDNQRFFRA